MATIYKYNIYCLQCNIFYDGYIKIKLYIFRNKYKQYQSLLRNILSIYKCDIMFFKIFNIYNKYLLYKCINFKLTYNKNMSKA